MNANKEILIPVISRMGNARTMKDTSHARVIQVSQETDTTVRV